MLIPTFTYAVIQTAFVADQLRASTAGFDQFLIVLFTENSLIFAWCLLIYWYRYSYMLVTKIEVMCLQILQYYTLLLVTNIGTNVQIILAVARVIVTANHYWDNLRTASYVIKEYSLNKQKVAKFFFLYSLQFLDIIRDNRRHLPAGGCHRSYLYIVYRRWLQPVHHN